MMETLDYIESYFTNTLSDTERKAFEQRCENDNVFAQEVALYTLTRESLREKLLRQKQAQWKQIENVKQNSIVAAPVRKMNFRQWVSYAAAACILLAVALVYLNGSTSPQQLAGAYIDKNIVHIGIEMSASRDSLETGMKYYNNKNYDSALNLFKALDNDLPVRSEAKKYEGYVYLVTKDYDNALAQFDELSNMDLYSNPGMFLKAVTLLRRNREGDKETAKELLNMVINDEKAEGKEEAKEMLKKF